MEKMINNFINFFCDNLYLLIIIILVILLLLYLYKKYLDKLLKKLSKPPVLELFNKTEKIGEFEAEYYWNFVNVENNVLNRDEINFENDTKNNKIIEIEQIQDYQLKFEFKPDEIRINLWKDNNFIKSCESLDEIFNTGSYIFEILVRWDESVSVYLIKVDLK